MTNKRIYKTLFKVSRTDAHFAYVFRSDLGICETEKLAKDEINRDKKKGISKFYTQKPSYRIDHVKIRIK